MTTIQGKCAIILLVLEILGFSLVSGFISSIIHQTCDTEQRNRLSCDERRTCDRKAKRGGGLIKLECRGCTDKTLGKFNDISTGYCFKAYYCDATWTYILDMQHRPATYNQTVGMMQHIASLISRPVQLPSSSNKCVMSLLQARAVKDFWASDTPPTDMTGERLAYLVVARNDCSNDKRNELSCDDRKTCSQRIGNSVNGQFLYKCRGCTDQTLGKFNGISIPGYCFKVYNCDATWTTILDMQDRPTNYSYTLKMKEDFSRALGKPVQLPSSSNECARSLLQARAVKDFWASDTPPTDMTGDRLAYFAVSGISMKLFKCQATCSWYVALTFDSMSFDKARELQSYLSLKLVSKTYFPRFDGNASTNCFNQYIGSDTNVWLSKSVPKPQELRRAFFEIDGECTVTLPGESGIVPVPGQPRMEMVMFLSPLPVTYAEAERVCEFNGAKVLPSTFLQNAQNFEENVLKNSQSSWLSPPNQGAALATDGKYHSTTVKMPRVLCQRDVRAGDTYWPNFDGRFTNNFPKH